MREIIETTQFKRDYKKIAASGRYSRKEFLTTVELLALDKPPPPKLRDHALIGEWNGYRECHIRSDWLLIYQKSDNKLILVRTGSHSELFA
ncbi:MAG: addiction module toxin RelE [Gammaproteobacteria bacterium RIFCSPHIGHO2_12_FULL_37_34]|nr:MAG: addiction module toxin RelE [Gammaproteobacteria bacterium RIFCSPHIGHO2_12_FULL_37_34]